MLWRERRCVEDTPDIVPMKGQGHPRGSEWTHSWQEAPGSFSKRNEDRADAKALEKKAGPPQRAAKETGRIMLMCVVVETDTRRRDVSPAQREDVGAGPGDRSELLQSVGHPWRPYVFYCFSTYCISTYMGTKSSPWGNPIYYSPGRGCGASARPEPARALVDNGRSGAQRAVGSSGSRGSRVGIFFCNELSVHQGAGAVG